MNVFDLSEQLEAELAANDQERVTADVLDDIASSERRLVDPSSLPARFHNLRACAISRAHGFASFQGFGDATLSTRIGSGTHGMLFAGDGEVPPVLCLPPQFKQRRGAKYDAWRKQQTERATVLTRKEYTRAAKMAASIRRHEVANNLLFGPGCIREQKILWTQMGRARQSTPDVRGPYHVAELKTARCTEPGKFVRDAGFRSYHVQLADQCAAIQAETGKWPEEVYVIAVENSDPYVTTVFQVSDATIRKGKHLAELWLTVLLDAERTGRWPGYSEKIELLDIPDDGLDVWEDFGADVPDWKKPSASEEE